MDADESGVVTCEEWVEFLEGTHKEKRAKKRGSGDKWFNTMMHTIIDASPRFRGKSKGGLYGDVVEEFDFENKWILDFASVLATFIR